MFEKVFSFVWCSGSSCVVCSCVGVCVGVLVRLCRCLCR